MAGEVGSIKSKDMMESAAEGEDVPKEKDKEVFSLESILWTARYSYACHLKLP